jgi:hypothetical protein
VDADGNLVLSGNGVAGWPYSILATADLSAPLTNWSVIFSGVIDPDGTFIFTNSSPGDVGQQFYDLQLK